MAVTVYTPAIALNANDTNASTNFRTFVRLSGASNGQLRVRFRSSSAGGLNIVGAAFGKWNGTAISATSSNMTTAPFRLTFAAANNVNIATNSTATSDLVSHPGVTLSAGDWIIVTHYCTTTANERLSTGAGNNTATTMFKAVATDFSQAQTAATMGNGLSVIGSIQPGSAGGSNYCIDLVETNDPASGSPYTMPAGNGTLTAAGQVAGLARSRKMPSVNGVLALAGQIADLDAGRRTVGGLGILTLAGQADRLAYARKPAGGKGQLTLAGPVVNLIYSGAGAKVLPAGLGFPVLSGRTAVLRYSRIMPAAVSMATLGGQPAILTYTALEGDIVMPVSAGVLRMAGQYASMNVYRVLQQPGELKFGRKVYLRRW